MQWAPPLSDGGSQVTGYRVDWDTNPGVFEVQTLKTTPNLGPNEIQSFTTYASVIPEVQSFHTRAANVYEVQTVRTFANMNELLGGSFTLAFDTTASGGGYYVSAQIPNNAAASTGASMRVCVCGLAWECLFRTCLPLARPVGRLVVGHRLPFVYG